MTNNFDQHEADVVVIGAGLAGLMAARALLRSGREPIVVEARDRIGGRVVNQPIGDDRVVEMGGQWVAPRDDVLRSIAAEHDIDLFPTFDTGKQLLELTHGLRSHQSSIPRLGPLSLLELGFARWKLDRQARTVPPGEPWKAPDAKKLDGQTLGSWMDRHLRTRDARGVLETGIATIFGGEPNEVTLLHALSFIHGAGDFDTLTRTRGGELQDRVVGGSPRIAQVLADEVGEQRMLFEHPADRIEHYDDSVVVRSGRTRVRARRAIIAVPPALAGRIRYEPALPGVRDQALQRLPMASSTKIAVVYDRPFWRERGLSGRSVSVRGPLTVTFDNSPPDSSPGVLIGFSTAARGRELARLPEPERRDSVINALKRLFGPDAGQVRDYFEKSWTDDEWARGCYFGLATGGALTGPLRILREPTGSLHWAGSETVFENYGGMDGALISGLRAADEVLAELSPEATRARADAAAE